METGCKHYLVLEVRNVEQGTAILPDSQSAPAFKAKEGVMRSAGQLSSESRVGIDEKGLKARFR
jgi:hypothetical protein